MRNYVSGLGLVLQDVGSVTVTNPGSGYFPSSSHYLQFSEPPLGIRALGTLGVWEEVRNVRVTEQGAGYMSAPTVVFDNDGTGGSRAAARAVMRWARGTTDVYNLNAARAALYGKELRVRIKG